MAVHSNDQQGATHFSVLHRRPAHRRVNGNSELVRPVVDRDERVDRVVVACDGLVDNKRWVRRTALVTHALDHLTSVRVGVEDALGSKSRADLEDNLLARRWHRASDGLVARFLAGLWATLAKPVAAVAKHLARGRSRVVQ